MATAPGGLGVLGAIAIRVDHGSYDEDDAPVKPLKLMGGDTPWLPQVARLADNSTRRMRLVDTKRFKGQDGKMVSQVHGKKHELSESEHYCEAFTKAVVDAYLEWRYFGDDDYMFVAHSGLPETGSASSVTLRRRVDPNRDINQAPKAEESQIEPLIESQIESQIEIQTETIVVLESQIESQIEIQTGEQQAHEAWAEESQQIIDEPGTSTKEIVLPMHKRPWAPGVLGSC